MVMATNEEEMKKYGVMVSEEAGKLIPDREEAIMLVQYALKAFKEEPEKNTFNMGKLDLVCVKNGTQLFILTKGEKERIIGK
jgi:hypothetical protein